MVFPRACIIDVSVPKTLMYNIFTKGLKQQTGNISIPDIKKRVNLNEKNWKPEDLPNKIGITIKVEVKQGFSTYQSIPLEPHLNQDEINKMLQYVRKNNKKLLQIANAFLKRGHRLLYHFLYELVSLFRILQKIPNYKKEYFKM